MFAFGSHGKSGPSSKGDSGGGEQSFSASTDMERKGDSGVLAERKRVKISSNKRKAKEVVLSTREMGSKKP